MRKLKYLSLILAATLIMTACGQRGTTTLSGDATTANTGSTATNTANDTVATSTTTNAAVVDIDDFDDEDYDTLWEISSASAINFDGTNATVTGNNVTANGSVVTINGSGTFVITGNCSDGNIIVDDAAQSGVVHLVLNGTSITSSTTAPIFVKASDKTVITLAEGSENSLEDASQYVYASAEETEPSAALFSKDDITINGRGILNINANLGDAIQGKDDLKIAGGIINITSTDDGLIGKDSVQVAGGTITIAAGGDGIKATNSTDTTKGNVVLHSGVLNITSEYDGVQAENQLIVYDGTYNITTGGGSENGSHTNTGEENQGWGQWGGRGDKQSTFNKSQSGTGTTTAVPQSNTSSDIKASNMITATNILSTTSVFSSNNITASNMASTAAETTAAATDTSETTSDSAKALKAVNVINIENGEFTINSSDDAVHSNGDATISGGTFNISSGDDGMHADNILNLAGGTVTISKSYEGLEALTINFQDGNYKITSSDDGLNAAGGNDSSAIGGRQGMNSFAGEKGALNISGGNLWIDAAGDGIDSNGTVAMSDGTVFVNGPTNNNNGALDYESSFDIAGGTLVAVGAAGMAQVPSTTSAQPSISMSFSSVQSANSVVCITDSEGNNIVTFAPSKEYQTAVISSPDLKSGSTYTLYNNNVSDLEDNELHINEAYSSGTEIVTFELSEGITYVNESGVTTGSEGGMGMGGMHGGDTMEGRGGKENFTAETNADGSTVEMPSRPDMGEMQMPANGQTPPDMPADGQMPVDTQANTNV